MSKLLWRVKLMAEQQPCVTTEIELACIERDAQAGLADLGLSLAEAKQLTAALQAEIVPMQVAALGECPRGCLACGRRLASKGYSQVRVRRLLACPCQGEGEAKSVAVLDFGKGAALAPELAYVTARYAALAPFGKVAALLSELLPLGGALHASTVRSRTLRVGMEVAQAHTAETAKTPTTAATGGPVVVGLDGGYVRNRHRAEGRRFEVIAGKVIHAAGAQHRFAFARTGPAVTAEAFRQALAAVGVGADTPATVLCGGDAGLWRLQRKVAAQCHGCARLVARRRALRARAASGPWPRQGCRRRAPVRHGGPGPGAREVAPVARALAGVPAQTCRPVSLDRVPHRARGGRH